MSQNVFQYFIGISLPKKENELFSFLKQQFHPQGRLPSPAHVTIISPFFHENERDLIEKLEAWSKEQKSFCVNFFQVGSFRQPKYGTIFLAPDKDEELKKIHKNLIESISYLPNKGDFVPHLTIANRAPFEKIEEIKKQLEDMNIKLELSISELTVYKRLAGESWMEYKKISF